LEIAQLQIQTKWDIKMGFCGGVVKASLWVLNFVLFLGGILIMAAGGYMHYQIATKYGGSFENEGSKAGLFGLAVGFVVAIVSFFGCCGLAKSNGCMMKAYAVLVAVLLIAEVGTGIAAAINKGEADEYVTRGLNSTLDKYNPEDETRFYIVEAWDAVQEELHCCGVDGYQDWQSSSGWDSKQDVPDSCCKTKSENCGKGASVSKIYQEGCKPVLIETIEDNMQYAVYTGLGFGLFQIILIVAACCIGKKMGYEEELMMHAA